MRTTTTITPVFTIGAGHSGTTIVYRMLSWHPQVAWLSQYSAQAPAAGSLLAAADRILRRVIAHSWKKGAYPWARRLAPVPVEGLRIWRFALDESLPIADAVRRVQRVIEQQCRQQRKSVFLAKPPGRYRSRCAPVVSAAFPTARYIHVLRDGRAVALSVLDKMRQSARGGDRTDLVAKAARHWIRALEQIGAYAATLPVHTIRYEALCDDVHGTLRAALEFAGLDPAEFPFRRCPPTLSSTNPSRLRAAVPEELAALDADLAPYLRMYGYAAPSSSGVLP